MRNKIISLTARLALLSTVIVSCVESIDFDTGYPTPLSVHCILTESDIQEIDIRPATSYGKNRDISLSDLSVELMNARGETICSFQQKDNTRWNAEMTPAYGEKYSLSIKKDGQEIICAKTTFPPNVYIKQFMKRRKGALIDHLYYSCELRIPYKDAEGFDVRAGAPFDGSANLWVFPKVGNLIGTTHPNADDFNLISKTVGTFPCFSLDSMKLWSLSLNEAKRWMKDSYQSLPLHDGFVRIPSPQLFDNGEDPLSISNNPLYTTRSFIFFADFPLTCSPNQGGLFDIRIVSDELDLYLKDIYQRELDKGRDMRYIYNHENAYTNISGGVGIFGAILYRSEESAIRGYNGDFIEQ